MVARCRLLFDPWVRFMQTEAGHTRGVMFVKSMLKGVFGACLLIGSYAWAQAPANAPSGATGLCKDGTYWTGQTKRGACRGHKGVQDWYGSANTAAGTTSGANGANAPTPAAGGAPGAATGAGAGATAGATAGAETGGRGRAGASARTEAAPGGGPGQVWVNTATKVYHCPGDRWYGKTKKGEYMSESAAKAAGDRPDHGKACSAQ